MGHSLKILPPNVNLETNRILKQLARSNRSLAELKGYADTIPNKNILINAITINEAKDSSAIENIITTHDELYKSMSNKNYNNPEAKEIVNYRTALWRGYELVSKRKMITTNILVEIQEIIEKNRAGIRKLPGTVLKNNKTGEIVYTPPESEEDIKDLLKNLEIYINEEIDTIDPLIKLGVIHYQFECIHPFYDGNGRTGRILNILYLVLKNLLDTPILYLSKYIIRNKFEYYRLIHDVTTKNLWEDWVIYILVGVEETAEETLLLLKKINAAIEDTQQEIKNRIPKIYSKELIEALFIEFYTKISYIENNLGVSRRTAVTYLNELEKEGFVTSEKVGKEKIYLNKKLFEIVKKSSEL